MLYHGFHIRITPCYLKRTDDSGREVICKGYWFEVFADEKMTIPLDVFGGAVGFELVEESMDGRSSLLWMWWRRRRNGIGRF